MVTLTRDGSIEQMQPQQICNRISHLWCWPTDADTERLVLAKTMAMTGH
jgi:hypothetical protein